MLVDNGYIKMFYNGYGYTMMVDTGYIHILQMTKLPFVGMFTYPTWGIVAYDSQPYNAERQAGIV